MEETMKSNKAKSPASKLRRKEVIARLEAQVERGTKPYNAEKAKPDDEVLFHDRAHKAPREVKLSVKDVERINKEIETLKTRI
jgi:hypothetical protein